MSAGATVERPTLPVTCPGCARQLLLMPRGRSEYFYAQHEDRPAGEAPIAAPKRCAWSLKKATDTEVRHARIASGWNKRQAAPAAMAAAELKLRDAAPALADALEALREWAVCALTRTQRCGDPEYECPMQDAHKPDDLTGFVAQAVAALRAAGRLP